jgi:hypothetical protein
VCFFILTIEHNIWTIQISFLITFLHFIKLNKRSYFCVTQEGNKVNPSYYFEISCHHYNQNREILRTVLKNTRKLWNCIYEK